MTLIELQEKLGEQIKILSENKDLISSDYKKAIIICNLAKQMINNADVLLRYSKLSLQDSVRNLLGNENKWSYQAFKINAWRVK